MKNYNASTDPMYTVHEQIMKDRLAEKLIWENRMDTTRIAQVLEMDINRVNELYSEAWDIYLGRQFKRFLLWGTLIAVVVAGVYAC